MWIAHSLVKSYICYWSAKFAMRGIHLLLEIVPLATRDCYIRYLRPSHSLPECATFFMRMLQTLWLD